MHETIVFHDYTLCYKCDLWILQMSGFRATKSGDAFRLDQKFEEVC